MPWTTSPPRPAVARTKTTTCNRCAPPVIRPRQPASGWETDSHQGFNKLKQASRAGVGSTAPGSNQTTCVEAVVAHPETTKICSACKQALPLSNFGRSSGYRDGRRGQCNRCRSRKGSERYRNDALVRERAREARSKNSARYRDADTWRHRIKKYGIDERAFYLLLEKQGGRCAICGTCDPGGPFGVFCVDHCHKTGAIRGILCSRCNVAIAALGDSLEGLQRAVDYLAGNTIPIPAAG